MKHECCTEKGKNHYSVLRCMGWGVLGVIGFAAIVTLVGFAIMALWNWLIPALFNLPVITYWQAVGLAVLARLLFGGCGKGFHHFHHRRHGFEGHYRCCVNKKDEGCCEDANEGECCKHEESPKV